jgi:uncharacterized protein
MTGQQQATNWSEGLNLMAGPYFIGLYQPSPETEGFWKGVEQRELLLKWCPHCACAFHPKRIVCTMCGSSALEWKRASGRAKVYSFSEVHHAAVGAFAPSVPYTVGMVELEEGVYLLSRLIAESGAIGIDAPARVDFRVLEMGQLLPVFIVGKGE